MNTRFIVQVKISDKWVSYCRRGSVKRTRYTLTKEEAFAYLAKVSERDAEKDDEAKEYRVISSTEVDGLINQAVVTV